MRRTTIINPTAAKRTTYEEAKSAFLKHCKLRNLRPQTIRYYEEDIVYFQNANCNNKLSIFRVRGSSI